MALLVPSRSIGCDQRVICPQLLSEYEYSTSQNDRLCRCRLWCSAAVCKFRQCTGFGSTRQPTCRPHISRRSTEHWPTSGDRRFCWWPCCSSRRRDRHPSGNDLATVARSLLPRQRHSQQRVADRAACRRLFQSVPTDDLHRAVVVLGLVIGVGQ